MTDAAAPTTAPTTTPTTANDGDYRSSIRDAVRRASAEPLDSETGEEADGAETSDASDGADSSPASGTEEAKPKPKAKADAKEPAEDDDAPPKVADDPKTAAKFAALARKSKAVRAEASAVAERERQVIATERALAEQATELREFQQVSRDPDKLLAWLEKRGVSLDRAVQHHLAEQDPERRAERTQQRALTEVEQLRKELAERDARERESQGAKRVADSERAFLELSSDETKFEAANLAYSDAERVRIAWHVDKLSRAKGLNYGLQEIAEAVNEFAEAGYELDSAGRPVKSERLLKKLARLRSGANAATDSAARAADTSPARDGSRHVTPARTLTNRDANERSTETNPEWDALPIKERVKRLAATARHER